MADYQSPHSFTLDHPGENNTGAQSGAASHPTQHIRGVMDGTPAHPLPTQIPQANEAGESTGHHNPHNHSRVNCNATHTCAACKATCLNNYTLERHAAKERHKAFLCNCGIAFGRLGSLNRHITAKDGPNYYCDFCDGNKAFAREDKLIDHLRASHKFGDKAIAQIRRQTRAKSKGTGPTKSAVPATGSGQPVSTSAGYGADSGAVSVGQMANASGITAGPSGGFEGGMNDFPMFSAPELQPFAPTEDYPWIGTSEDFTCFDFSGLDFSSVEFADSDNMMGLSWMDSHL